MSCSCRHELTTRIKLIGEASTLDGKRYVNDAIGVVIERVQGKIMPYLPTLAQSIPGLCEFHGFSCELTHQGTTLQDSRESGCLRRLSWF